MKSKLEAKLLELVVWFGVSVDWLEHDVLPVLNDRFHSRQGDFLLVERFAKDGSDEIFAIVLGINGQFGIIMGFDEGNFVLHGLCLQFKLFPGFIKLFFYNGLDIVDFLEEKEGFFHELRIGS